VSDDKRDPPIDEHKYLSGVTVVDIGDYRVSRGQTRREYTGCPHRRLTYDQAERRIWCRDCERDIESFDAFMKIVEGVSAAIKKIDAREKRVAEAEAFQARSLAAKALDKAWRKRRMVPACPHCRMGLFPEDFKNGVTAMLGRDYAEAQLRARAASKRDRP
jgi:hypothetical protein